MSAHRERPLSWQRYYDIAKMYRQIAPFCVTQTQAYEEMAGQAAPRFYVNPRQAALRIARILKYGDEELQKMRPTTRALYADLMEVYESLRQDPRFENAPLLRVMSVAVRKPAKSFYLYKRGYSYALKYVKTHLITDINDILLTKQKDKDNEHRSESPVMEQGDD